jgi:hypothetical protein
MKRRVGDRRSKPRFEILGDLWGRIDTTVSIQVQNIGRGGALLESSSSLEPDSTHWVTALIDGQPHLVHIRVRHSRRESGSVAKPRFSIGVEFLDLPAGVEEAFRRLRVEADGGVSAEV